MFETVSVDDAIKRGQRNVNGPVFLIQFGLWGLCVILIKYTHTPTWLIGTIAVLAFVLAWLYWSFAITYWRLWAFENVDDVFELEIKAIQGKLIWPPGHFFEKTEIRSKAQREQWEIISQRFYNDYD